MAMAGTTAFAGTRDIEPFSNHTEQVRQSSTSSTPTYFWFESMSKEFSHVTKLVTMCDFEVLFGVSH